MQPLLNGPTRYLRQHPLVRVLRRAVDRRVIGGWRVARRAWRRSLQLRMAVITLLVSGVLVGAFGVVVASMITEGLVNAKVTSARDQVSQGAQAMKNQLETIKDPLDPSLDNSISGVLSQLAATTEGASVAILADDDASGQQTERTSPDNDRIVEAIPAQLRAYVRGEHSSGTGMVAHQFVTADLGDTDQPGVQPYLVFGSPVTVSFGHFELYYLFPLRSEQQAADLVRTTIIATGVALVVLMAALAALTTRLVVRPVRTAARTAQRLSAGLLDQRMEVHGEDDLALLAASFNQMAENLQRQISRLEEMSRLQRRFTSDVSHELRTPLTTVRMAADLIYAERDEFDPAMARSAELLHAELDRFEELLTDLLEISRFDAGFAVLDAEPTDAVPIVEAVVERLRPLARRAGVPIHLDAPPTPVIVEVDQRRVDRVLRNLVGNAVEHAEGRPVVVTLRADETALAVTVRDYGIGLRPGEEKLVFNRFWRADPSRARQTGGTGLGLSIGLEDARLHGGWLEAWGTPGRGAQFRLTVPLRAGDRLTSSPLPLVPVDGGRLPAPAGPPAIEFAGLPGPGTAGDPGPGTAGDPGLGAARDPGLGAARETGLELAGGSGVELAGGRDAGLARGSRHD